MPELHLPRKPRAVVSPAATLRAVALMISVMFAATLVSDALTFKVLYSFTGGSDGGGVWSSVVMDQQGNLYGTTSGGGVYGYGTVFEVSPNSDGTWSETVLYSFMYGDPNGQEPTANLIFDAAGNLYGTTPIGGQHNAGTVFALTPGSGGWSLSLLYTFGSYKGDAGPPRGGLLLDAQGNLYGAAGGGKPGAGAVFKLSPGGSGWTESVLYNFGSSLTLGIFPEGNLIFDAGGSLYGTTAEGGDLSCTQFGGGYCGVVYRLWLSPVGWKETVLHSFTGGSDGAVPGVEQLISDSKARLYGTTLGGGSSGCGSVGCGAIFRLIHGPTGWKESVIHQFGTGANGSTPVGGLIFDQAGNAYGATGAGGNSQCVCGVVYKLVPGANGRWKYSVLHTFNGSDGEEPENGLIMDAAGNLYGTTVLGGPGSTGVVFEITP